MERKLLLLGLLRGSEMYGYQLNEIIDTHLSTSIHLTRPTAYRLLNQMAEDGWVEFHEEQEGNRPTRRVFSLTLQGERVYQERLRLCLEDYTPPEYQSAVCLAFLDDVDVTEAVSLLKIRKQKISEMLNSLREDDSHHGSMKFIIDHHKRHLQTEIEWVQDVIDQIIESELPGGLHE